MGPDADDWTRPSRAPAVLMSADLTLPGTIPGLLRRGSPVVLTESVLCGDYWAGYPGMSGVVVEIDHDVAWVAFGGDNAALVDVPLTSLALELTDATGRAHADWYWRRAHIDREYDGDSHPTDWWVHSPHLGGGYRLSNYRRFPKYRAILSHLDPKDFRLLPDGSRWADVEALRLVCLHVAGVTRG